MRAVWTFADGTRICPQDDHKTAELFRKMLAGLTPGELRLLDVFVQRELAAKMNPSVAVPGASPLPSVSLVGQAVEKLRAAAEQNPLDQGAPPTKGSMEPRDAQPNA